MIDVKLAAKIIRKALKLKCKTLRVRMARGTAYGWIDIYGSGKFGVFTEEERRVLDEIGLPYGANCAVISPESLDFWIKKLCKLIPEAEAYLIAVMMKNERN